MGKGYVVGVIRLKQRSMMADLEMRFDKDGAAKVLSELLQRFTAQVKRRQNCLVNLKLNPRRR